MTRFTVTWLESAQNRLAEIWNESGEKQAVADAANHIDRELATDPHTKGSPVSEGLRALHVPPLHVLFEVREPDRIVEVALLRTEQSPPTANDHGNGQTKV